MCPHFTTGEHRGRRRGRGRAFRRNLQLCVLHGLAGGTQILGGNLDPSNHTGLEPPWGSVAEPEPLRLTAAHPH